MVDIEVEFTTEEYEVVKEAASLTGETIEEFVLRSLYKAVEDFVAPCVNCGADVHITQQGLRHKRSKAFHCDLDDESSLVAQVNP